MKNIPPSRWKPATLLALLLLCPGLAIPQMCPAPKQPPSWLDASETPACDGADGAEVTQCTACLGGNAAGSASGMMRVSVQSLLVSLAISDKPLD